MNSRRDERRVHRRAPRHRPRLEPAERGGHQPAGDRDRHHPDEDHRREEIEARLVEHVAETQDRADQLARHERGPARLEREPEAGEDERQRAREQHLAREHPSRHAERARRFDEMRLDRADAGVAVDHGRHERREPDDEHLGRVAEPEPHDRERDPCERRDRAHQQERRVDERLGAAAPAHQHAERHADRHRGDEAEKYEVGAVEEVLVELAVGVALEGDLARRLPDLGGRREIGARDQVRRGGGEVPERGQRGERRRADREPEPAGRAFRHGRPL